MTYATAFPNPGFVDGNSALRPAVLEEPGSAPAIRVKGLGFRVGERTKQPVDILDCVDLTIRPQEFVSIVGPSGCGKSTLLNFIAGLTPVQKGCVDIFGLPPGESQRIGYMFQQHALLPWRTVLRNVELGLELAGVSAEERRQKALQMLAAMGLRGFESHYPNELSGGMRQRASLARTLVADPSLILMDEPFGALDAQTKIFIQEMFSHYWEAHRKTVLFVTHDLNEAVALSDRVLVMGARPGRIIAEHVIDLPRPRDFNHLVRTPGFTYYVDEIWNDLRVEAAKALQGRP